MAELLLTSDSVSATRRVVRYVRPIFMGTDESPVAHKKARNAINGARRNIVQRAKVDLNLSEMIQNDVTATTPDISTADSDAPFPIADLKARRLRRDKIQR